MNQLISIDYSSLAAYGTIATLTYQGLKSASSGSKKLVTVFTGSATSQPFSKNYSLVERLFGQDSLRERAHHLSQSVQHFFLSGVCLSASYIIFLKGVCVDPTLPIHTGLAVNETAWNEQKQDFQGLIQTLQELSRYYKELDQFLSFGAKFSMPDDCKRLLQLTDPIKEPNQRRLSECVTEQLYYTKYLEKYRQDTQMISHLKEHNFKKISYTSNSESGSSALAVSQPLSEDSKDVKMAILGYTGELADRFENDKRAAIDTKYKPLYSNATLRLKDYIRREMKQHFGPLTIHGDKICDSKEPSHRFFFNTCDEYLKRKQDLAQFANYQKEINNLNPSLYNTDGKTEVFEPILKELIHLYMVMKKELSSPEKLAQAVQSKWGFKPDFIEALIKFRESSSQD